MYEPKKLQVACMTEEVSVREHVLQEPCITDTSYSLYTFWKTYSLEETHLN